MKYLSYITKHCEDTGRKFNQFDQIEKISKKIERDQSIQSWDFFLPTPYIKKDLGRSYRLVCSRHTINDDYTIIAFIACFARGGDGTYEKFINNSSICDKWLPSDDELLSYIKKREQSDDPPPPPLPKPNEIEARFLFDSIKLGNRGDLLIYESEDWVEEMKRPTIIEKSTRIYDLLLDKITYKPECHNGNIVKDDRSGISILFKYFSKYNCIFLIAIILPKEENKIKEYNKKYNNLIKERFDSFEFILKNSRRSYPAYIIADENIWTSIEKNEAGNISLSPEESNILENIILKSQQKLFPLFINGRPGSGKSTILQYIFASYLVLYLRSNIKELINPPLYLTYSDSLLESAQGIVKTILHCNADLSQYELDLKELDKIKDNCFGIFHKFIYNLLPHNLRERFDFRKKIDFSIFKKIWDARRKSDPNSEVRELTPELVWHVLRSYIKGMRYDELGEFTLDSFKELPSRQRSVQEKTFEIIYNNIWQGWYKPFCLENNFWDDQDLVYTVLNNINLDDLARYPAIFCDEAQDFSKLELELILKLNLYSRRALLPNELKFVPFTFAGDPFQTLNPTGFDFDSLQANFHEKIVSGLDKNSNSNLEFNYQELSYNYRSARFIVGFCNLIQLLRGILFDQMGLIPQKTWFDSSASMPVIFNLKDPLCERKLKEQTELVIILPCQEGEEEDFVKNDDFLSKLSKRDIDLRNFLSPMRAKGLEFSRVVLYKFGSICKKSYPNFLDPLIDKTPHSINMDQALPLKYFINRLYVAASRAKNMLIIVDDDEGINFLWENRQIQALDTLIEAYKNSSKYGWNSELINYVQEGTENIWDQNRDDPESLAKEFHQSGFAERDPYKLRLAEANYYRCGEENLAKLCRAERYEIEEKFREAGKLYLELSKKEKALENFWKAEEFNIIAQTQEFENTPEQRAAHFYLGDKSKEETEHFLEFLLEQIKGSAKFKFIWDPLWKKFVDQCLSVGLTLPKSHNKIYSLLKELEINGFKPSNTVQYAQLAFQAEDYIYAIELWEENPSSQNNQQYYKAKSITADYPDNLDWLDKLGDHNKIITEYLKNTQLHISDKHSNIIFDAILKLDRYDVLYDFAQRFPKIEYLLKVFELSKRSKYNDHIEEIGIILIQALVKDERWHDISELINDLSPDEKAYYTFTAILAHEVALSNTLEHASVEQKNAIGSLFRKAFIDLPWKDIVPMRIAGAALEKAYKIIDVLAFYEQVWKKNKIHCSQEDKDYAIARWVRFKLNYADFLDKENLISKASKHRIEAEKICSEYLRINKDNIPQQPEIPRTIKSEIRQRGRLSDIPSDKKEAIKQLYDLGHSIDKLVSIFELEPDIIELVLKI